MGNECTNRCFMSVLKKETKVELARNDKELT